MTGNAQKPNVVPDPVRAMPEWLTRHDRPSTAYTVVEGEARRGEAWTNIGEGRMKVPFGSDETSRVIRAHEMMHAKVSPVSVPGELAGHWNVPMNIIVAAEEFRVNMLVDQAGFDLDDLCDGSEVRAGEIAGKNNNWNGAVEVLLACAGTKAGNDFVRGVGKSNNEMMLALREVHKALKKEWRAIVRENKRKRPADGIGSTFQYEFRIERPDETFLDVELPAGFARVTQRLADFAARFLVGDGDGDPGDIELPDADDIKQKTAATGRWGRLIELPVPKPRTSDGIIGRKRIATNVGRNPRRISRLLTDPEKRVFDRKTRGRGGVVLIDQSGSMRLSEADIWEMVEAAPGCVIIGYSHRPGSTGVPNIWVIAERGKVCDRDGVPHGNGGNGVDGPAVEFAQKKRLTGEPFIWVCDGIVTDHLDHSAPNLTRECQAQVRKYGIHMVNDTAEAVSALKRAAHGKLPMQGRQLGIMT